MADRLLTIGDVYKPLQATEVLNFMVAKDTMEEARFRNRINNMLLAETEEKQGMKNDVNAYYRDNPNELQAGGILKVPANIAARNPLLARQFEQDQQAAITKQKMDFLSPLAKGLIEAGDSEGFMKLMSAYDDDPHISSINKKLRDMNFTVTGKNETEVTGNYTAEQIAALAQKAGNPTLAQSILSSPAGRYNVKMKGDKISGFEPSEEKLTKEQLYARALKGDKEAQAILDKMKKDDVEVAKQKKVVVNPPGAVSQVEALAKGILDGTIDPNGISKRGGLQAAVWGKVKELNPNFDIVGAGVQAKFRGSTGTMQTKALLNSIEPLLTKLEESGKVLGNDRFQFVNRPKNWLKEQMGYDDIVGFNNLRDDTIAEVERGLLGTGVLSDSKYLRAVKNINSAQSFSQLQAALRNIRFVIEARLEALAAGPETKETNRPKGDLTKQVNSWEALKKKRGW